MSALVVTIARFGLLILLWLFIFFTLNTVRNDVYGGRLLSRNVKQNLHTPVTHNNSHHAPAASAPAANAPSVAQSLLHTAPKLYILQGALAGTTIQIGKAPVNVGRSPDSTIVLDDGYASARHARFFFQNGQVILEDLNSTNGTWVGNQQIHDAIALARGARITIGKTVLELQ